MMVRRGEAKTPKGALKAKTESQELIPNNSSRVSFYITNAGSNHIWIALGPEAKKEEGPFLAKEGGSFTDEHYTGPVSVVTKEGESLVTFAEL